MPHFVCNRCNRVFDESEAIYERFRHDEVRPIFTELIMTCPDCGAVDYETAAYCYKCGKPSRYGDLKGGYYCAECLDEMTNTYHMKLFIKEESDAFAEWLFERRQDKPKRGVDTND